MSEDRIHSTPDAPSHSRLSTFSQCQRKYFYRYVLMAEPPMDETDPRLVGGKLGHERLQRLYDQGFDQLESILLDTPWPEGMAQQDPWTQGALDVTLRNYVRYWGDQEDLKPLRFKPKQLCGVVDARYEVDAEGYVQFNESTFVVSTPVGNILIQPDMVAKDWNDELCVVDHKFTGQYLGQRVYGDALYGFQLKLYAYGMGWLLGQDVGKAYLNAIHIGPAQASGGKSKAKLFERYSFDFTPSTFDDVDSWLTQIKRQTEELEAKDLDDTWWIKSAGEHCSYCAFKDFCVAPTFRRKQMLQPYYEMKEASHAKV